MITDDIVDMLKIMVEKDPEEMTRDELLESYKELVMVMVGMMIGSRMTTEEVKKILKKKGDD